MPNDAKARAEKRAAQAGVGLTPEPAAESVPEGADARAEKRAAQAGVSLTPEPGEAGPGA